MRYYKIMFLTGMFSFLLATFLYSAENIAPGATITGQFNNLKVISDIKTEGNEAFSAESEEIGSKNIKIDFDLQSLFYIKEIKIYWANEGIAKNFSLWLSKSKVENDVISGLDGTKGKKEKNTLVQTIELHSRYSRYISLVFPSDTILNKGKHIKIKEIEIIKEENPKLALNDINYSISDREISIRFKTDIDAKSQIFYGEDTFDGKLEAPLRFIMPRTLHSGVLYGLKPDTKYRFQVEVSSTDIVKSEKSEFIYVKTQKNNLAFGKPVIGTFTHLPEDKFVSKTIPAIERLTDGGMDYFTSLALSGSVAKKDQFIAMDLTKTCNISEVILYWWALSYSKSFNILVSLDNKNWEAIGTGLNAGDGIFTTTGAPMYVYSHKFPPKGARYIKVQVPQNSPYYDKQDNCDFVSLFEIKVF
ncbi:MAG: hypothetical protein DKM50_13055 [Candidatus Margulisiibacteriota bacterium]|nr:MAG: hypothetical protein A2X43_13740 [Candidatus Margulisbacteria bacterium GWD2_39_127]OGI05560.1 MAG: hypothetical protein A2X42_00710 [Candidatus Margulisbacteria bacterium GWF2_38_17]OGI08358.1 MAG: hypothetical protein A2X41_10630 [Candidatus Margulisbacteria bacterium GWE2_39_32]PZM77329.1 MAG: hypothetical protein DKM50_13055 [Candidatus Margulisiibacteriota bacterium]HAR63161.1 hypothetical protein [Candidatus Margulisiibacteriota bacterium]